MRATGASAPLVAVVPVTPAGWKRLAGLVAARSATEAVPSAEARIVLQALVRARADGREVPPQKRFARQLGLSYATLRRRLGELEDCGLLAVEACGRGGAEYDLSEDRLTAWAKGVLVFVGRGEWDEDDDEDDKESAHSEHISAPKSAHSEHISLAGARGLAGGVGEVGAEVARAASQQAEVEERTKAAVAVLRSGGVRVPALVVPTVQTWVERGMEPEDFEDAAMEAARAGVQAWSYVEKILDRKLREVSKVTSLEHYRRAGEPWPANEVEEG